MASSQTKKVRAARSRRVAAPREASGGIARNGVGKAPGDAKGSGKALEIVKEEKSGRRLRYPRPPQAIVKLSHEVTSARHSGRKAIKREKDDVDPKLPLAVPRNLQCGCGCLELLARMNKAALSKAHTEAMRCRGDDTKLRKRKADDGNRRTHYGPEFENYAREWCRAHLKAVDERQKKKEGKEERLKMLLETGSSHATLSEVVAHAGGVVSSRGDGVTSGYSVAGDDYKVCMKGAGVILGVSMGFFYERSKRSQKSRIDEWAGVEADEGREILNVKDCCKGYDLCCIREDVNFRTISLKDVNCCSGSPHNRQRCKLKQLLQDCPGLVQDWHDAYHMKHAERGKTRVEQRAVIGEALHAGVCRNGIRLLLNSRVSSSRFQEIRVFIRDHGNSYRSLMYGSGE